MAPMLSQAIYKRMVRSRVLRESLETLHALSGLDVMFLDHLGNERLLQPRAGGRRFLRLLRQQPETWERVTRQRMRSLVGEATMDELGFVEVVYPLQSEQKMIGYIVLSAARPPGGVDALRALWLNQARQGGRSSWSVWYQSWSRLPEWTDDQRKAWLSCLQRYGAHTLDQLKMPGVELNRAKAFPPLVQRGCEVIAERYTEPLTLREVAAACGVSPEHLSRLFHQTTGLRFREYLAEVRIHHACVQLHDSDAAVSEIALDCGYASLSRFNAAFKSLVGMTPRDWRKRGPR